MADLLEAYRKLDPAKPLEGNGLEPFYVSRQDDPTAILSAQLTADTRPVRVRLAGQRGVGKTTELHRLARDLTQAGQKAYYYDIGERGLSIVHNIVNGLAHALVEQLSLQPGVPAHQRSVSALKTVVAQGVNRLGKPFVLLIDGMERTNKDEQVLELMQILQTCECSVVLATRLSAMLVFDINNALFEGWEQILLTAYSVYQHSRTNRDKKGWETLEAVLERRIGTEAIQRSALDILLPASGGISRELIWLAGYACLLAHQRGKLRVTAEEATAAVRQMQLKYTPGLTSTDLGILKHFAVGDRVLVDGSLLDQVNLTRIVAYHGPDGLWWDVHPILWSLVGIRAPEV